MVVGGAYLFECPLCEEVTFNPRECLMRVIIRLLYQSQLFSLGLIESTLDTTERRPHPLISDNYDAIS